MQIFDCQPRNNPKGSLIARRTSSEYSSVVEQRNLLYIKRTKIINLQNVIKRVLFDCMRS